MLKAIGEMEKVLRKYYQKTAFPTVYADGMILNPRTKLIIFEDPSWADTSADEYSNACRRRFVEMYDHSNTTPASTSAASTSSVYTSAVSNSAVSTSAAASSGRSRRTASTLDPESHHVI